MPCRTKALHADATCGAPQSGVAPRREAQARMAFSRVNSALGFVGQARRHELKGIYANPYAGRSRNR